MAFYNIHNNFANKENISSINPSRHRVIGETPQTSTTAKSVYNTPRRAPIAAPPARVFSPVMYRRYFFKVLKFLCLDHNQRNAKQSVSNIRWKQHLLNLLRQKMSLDKKG